MRLSFLRAFSLSALCASFLSACGGNGPDEGQTPGDGDGDVAYECFDNSGCGAQEECSGGSCVAIVGCSEQSPCPLNSTCTDGVCRAQCLDDSACAGLTCDVAVGLCMPIANPVPGTGGSGTGGSDGAGAGTSTGGAGTGTGGTTIPAGATIDMIDDFEDGDVDIIETSGRVGFWYTYNETSGGNDSQASARPLAPNPATSEGGYASHATGTHLTGDDEAAYGGIGVDLNNLNADGFQSRSSSRKSHDASAWDGVQFRVKSTGGDKSIRFEVVIAATSSGPAGTCNGSNCWDAYGRDVTFTAEWTTIKIPFSSLVQEGWGEQASFDAATILGFAWEDLNANPWDFWIDDLEFYKEAEVVTTPGGGTPMSCGDSWGEESNGSLTWYTFDQGTTGIGDINCSYGIIPAAGGTPDKVNHVHTGDGAYFAAINTADYNQSATCGACVEITRDNGKSVIATVVDQCPIDVNPKCVKGHIDLSKAAFLQIGTEVEGYVGQRANNGSVSWKYVSCPSSGNVKFRLKENNANWNQVIVENHPHPIAAVQVMVDGTWVNASRESYNFWIPPGGRFGGAPYQVRATDINGNTVTGSLSLSASSQDSGAQFVCE